MSQEWSTVCHQKNKRVTEAIQELQSKKANWEARQVENQRKQAEWEARQVEKQRKQREKEDNWVAKFDAEFPPVSAKGPQPSREYKIQYMRERGKSRFENLQAKQKEYDERQKTAYDRKEERHVAELKAALGPKWYNKVAFTEADCQLASIMRYEDDLEDQRAEWDAEIAEREAEKRWEEERKEEKRKTKEYMATLSSEELKKYKRELREQAEEDDYAWECGCYDDADQFMRNMRRQEAENKEMDERWAAWTASQATRPAHHVWRWSEMKKLIKQ
jgi:hypothetical protein